MVSTLEQRVGGERAAVVLVVVAEELPECLALAVKRGASQQERRGLLLDDVENCGVVDAL